MRKFLCLILIVVFVLCFAGCNQNASNSKNPTTSNDETNITEPTLPPNSPEVLIPETIKIAKETLGDEYYPSVNLSEDEIVKLFKISKEDYENVFGQICQGDGQYDLLIGVKATGDGTTVENLFFDYLKSIINDNNVPESVRAAFRGCLVSRDTDGYVYLIGTVGNIDSVAENGTEAITIYAEKNCLKVSEAISERIHS